MPEDVGYAWRALSVVGLASILTSLNASALNTALPAISDHFHASASATSWVLLSYLLVGTASTLAWGRCADLFGRRTMYLAGLAIYTGASLALGFAPSIQVLLIARIVQAAASAMLLTNSAAIVSAAFPPRLLSTGMGIYLSSFSLAALVGPTVGGALVTVWGWQWVFWFNVPVGLACLIWGFLVLRRTPGADGPRSLDLRGNALFAAATVALLLALSEVGLAGWNSPVVLIGLAVFVVLMPAFVLLERQVASPVLDLALLTDRTFAIGNAAAFLNVLARSSVVLVVALYFQAVRGDTALHAGIAVLPLSAAVVIGSLSIGRISRRFSPRVIAAGGSAVATVGLFLLLVTVGPHVDYALMLPGILLVGLGSGMFMPANVTAILDGTPPDRLGAANAVRLVLQNTAMVMGSAVSLTLLAAPLPAAQRAAVFTGGLTGVDPHTAAALVRGYRATYVFMVIVSLAGTALSILSSRRSPAEETDAASAAPDVREGTPCGVPTP